MRAELIAAAVAAGKAYMIGDKKKAMAAGMDAFQKLLKGPGPKNDPEAAKRAVQIRSTLGDAIQLSGCRDDQTSADANIAGEATGAMSWALIKVLSAHKDITYTQMLGEVREVLQGKFSQIPQLSAGSKLQLGSTKFIL